MPFGSRARIFPHPAPPAEIVLDELSARYVKLPVAGLVEGSDKALEQGTMETGEPEGGVECGGRKLLVAGKAPRNSTFGDSNE
jgi:nitrogenase subunit NifH